MLKVLLVFSGLWISAAIGEDCQFQMELWSATNPTEFCYCHPITNTTAIGECMPNTGFVKNDTVSGCVPWGSWKDACVNKVDASTITCEGTNFMQPSGVDNPQTYLLCIEQGSAPVQLQCPVDRGFYSSSGFLGCFPWDLWRNLTGCTD